VYRLLIISDTWVEDNVGDVSWSVGAGVDITELGVLISKIPLGVSVAGIESSCAGGILQLDIKNITISSTLIACL
jgi:hypothetical protein